MTDAQNPTPETEFKPAKIPDGVVMVNGKKHHTDTRGALVPANMVKSRDLLQDETARKIIGHAIALSEQVSRFKAHVAEDISLFEEILAMDYGATIGGPKGNKTILSYDGLFKVSVRTADKYEFGPELQTAKALVDECVNDWSDGARDELKVFVTEAFNVNQEGKVSRSALLRLKKWDIEDERWTRALQAIKDAEREVGSATYFHCHRRASTDAPWEAITIDLAKA
ncbi:DUF3164 family protein [Phaeobacter sp. 11ANDIMAR09]|uniref:DUF3164 family protein n=1 Tax=Phaeobacter sp. 11ANDIMAR09 TaxID=1225647 RepID=UPI0006C8B0E3|nr:DUF3164 family protein [Phaeobacter sp. 11ANDIMAR09]KPD10885.1 sulfate transporter [Phaeobacter sp. 11ANDIMAR09]